jgi:hypothetical protein
VIYQILQISVIGSAATTKNLDAKFGIKAQHVFTPVVQVIFVENGGSVQLGMIERRAVCLDTDEALK